MKILKIKDENELINYVYADTIYKFKTKKMGVTEIFCNFPEGEKIFEVKEDTESLIKKIHEDDTFEIIDTIKPPEPPFSLGDQKVVL